jgi:hypothetical protein
MKFESYMSELNGYLKALQRVSGNGFSFGVRYYLVESDDIDFFITKQIELWGETDKLQYISKSKISYRSLVGRIKRFIFSGILSHERLANQKVTTYFESVLLEDINEFYCLASTTVSSSDSYYPLIQGPVYLLDIKDSSKNMSLYYLVQIGNYYVLTFFSKR